MDKELENLLKDVLKEFKDLAHYLKGSNKVIKENARNTKDEINIKKIELKTIKNLIEKRKEAGESFDDLQAELDDTTKDIDELGKSADKTGSKMKSLPGKILGFFKKALEVTGGTLMAFTDMSKPITSLTDVINAGIDEIPGFGKVALGMARDFDVNRESFKALAMSGAMFNGNLLKLSKVAGDASIPLPKLTDLITQNAAVLGAFYGSVQAGTNQFVSLGRDLRTMTERDLAKFGLTTDETAEYLMTFLEAERSRGNLTKFTNAELVNMTKNYTERLAKLSAMTGKSIDQLNQEQQAANADALFRAKLATMDKNTADIITKAYSQMGPGMQQLTKDMLAFEGPVSMIGREITAATQGEILGPLQRLLNNAGDDDALRQFQNSVGRIGENLLKDGQQFADVAILTGDFAGVFEEFVPRIREQLSKEGLAGIIQELNDSGRKAVNVFSQFDAMSARMQELRVASTLPASLAAASALGEGLAKVAAPGGPLEKFTKGLTDVTDHIYGLIGIETSDDKGKPSNKNKKQPNLNNYSNFDFDYGFGDGVNPKLMYSGSNGFQDFGRGTPAILHGTEAVVPKNDLGQALEVFKEAMATGMPISERARIEQAVTNNNNTNNMDMSTLNANTEQLIALNERVANHLNTLITIGAMTEKNTKNTTKQLANRTGSLV